MTVFELLNSCFAQICGQYPDHTWSPGGTLLPLCQRCTGMYAGAAIAALLQIFIRPRLNSRWLELHGAFLLIMVPFGFRWVPQGPVLRAVTGVLFGFGVVAFLWLEPGRVLAGLTGSKKNRLHPKTRHFLYALALPFTSGAVPWMGNLGGSIGAVVLIALATTGAALLLLLFFFNVGLGLVACIRAGVEVARTRKAL